MIGWSWGWTFAQRETWSHVTEGGYREERRRGVLAAFARGWSRGLVLGVLANEPSWRRQGITTPGGGHSRWIGRQSP